MVVHQLLLDPTGQGIAVAAADGVQRKVNGGAGAGAVEADRADLVERLHRFDVGMATAKLGQAFPVQGHGVLDQPGVGQAEDTGVQRPQTGALGPALRQPVPERLVHRGHRLEACAHRQTREPGGIVQVMLDAQGNAVAGGDRLAVAADQVPAKQRLSGQTVGDSQGIDGREQRHHGETRQQQKADGFRDRALVGQTHGGLMDGGGRTALAAPGSVVRVSAHQRQRIQDRPGPHRAARVPPSYAALNSGRRRDTASQEAQPHSSAFGRYRRYPHAMLRRSHGRR